MVLDVMFDQRVPRWALSSDRFAEVLNARSHGLSDAALDGTLIRLEGEGLIFSEPGSRGHTYFGLTAAGGATWEKDRVPDWGTYCNVSEMLPDESPLWVVEVVVYDRDVGLACLRRAKESGVYPDVSLDELDWVPSNYCPIYWRSEPRPWSATFRGLLDENRWLSQTSLYENRSWWSDINELTERLSRRD